MVAAAVIIHLVTDGTYYGDQKQETISVQLLDTKDQSHDLGKHTILGLVHPRVPLSTCGCLLQAPFKKDLLLPLPFPDPL